jgi:WD40 repeat protein
MNVPKPEFHLTRVLEDGAATPPEILPVTAMPWETRMDRRGALGAGLTATAALLLLGQDAVARERVPAREPDDPTLAPAPTGYAHVGRIHALCQSADGSLLASASSDNTVKLWTGGRWRTTLVGHSANVNALAICGDGRWLASASNDGTVRLWSLPDGQPGPLLDGPPRTLWSLAATGSTLIAGSDDGSFRVWSVPEGRLVATIEAHDSAVWALVTNRDGTLMASAAGSGGAALWQLPECKRLRALPRQSGSIEALAISPDGTLLVGGGSESAVKVWSTSDLQLLATFQGHSRRTTALAFAPDGRTVASSSEDQSVRLWSVSEARTIATLRPNDFVTALAFTPDGRLLFSGDRNGIGAAWGVAPARFEAFLADPALGGRAAQSLNLRAHNGAVTALATSADNGYVVSTGADKTARVWSIPDGQLRGTVVQQVPISALQLVADGRLVALGVVGEIGLWQVPPAPAPTTGGPQRRPVRPPPPVALTRASALTTPNVVNALALTPDGTMLLSGSAVRRVTLWALPEGREVAALDGHAAGTLAVSADGRFLASHGANENSIRLWSLPDRRLLTILRGRTARALVFTADGRRLVTAAGDNRIVLWELPNGRLEATLEGHESPVECLALSREGTVLVSGSADRAVKLWSLAEKRLLATLDGHAAGVTNLAVVLDGRHFVSAASDGGIRLWSLDAPYLEATLAGHTSAVQALAVSPDGRWLVSGDQNGVAILWDLSKPALQTYLFDPEATTSSVRGTSYNVYDQVLDRWITYTLPCGSPIPRGAVCTCNCVPGAYVPPAPPVPTRTPSAPRPTYSPGGVTCRCNRICTCVPVPSSRRWKTRIRPLERALDQIEQLRGVRFDWTAEAPHGLAGPDVGLIAEEVAQVVPEAVACDEHGAPVGIDYARLTAVLVEAVKAQQGRIAALERDVQRLRSKAEPTHPVSKESS